MGAGLTWQQQREQQQQQRRAAERRHSAGRGGLTPGPAGRSCSGQRAGGGDCGRTERPRRARPGPTLGISSPLAFGEKRGEGQGRPEEGGRDAAGRGGPQGGGSRRTMRGAHEGPRAPAPSGPSTAPGTRLLPNSTGSRRQLRRAPSRHFGPRYFGGRAEPSTVPSPGPRRAHGHGEHRQHVPRTRCDVTEGLCQSQSSRPEPRTGGGAERRALRCSGQVQHRLPVPEHTHTRIKLPFPHMQANV